MQTSASPAQHATIAQPTIQAYFDNLNRGELQAVSCLFAPDGELHAPFEKPIIGRKAIADYLTAEAKGFVLLPQQIQQQSREDGNTEYQIGGKVQTPLFTVHVGWRFVLNAEQEIALVAVKLLASLQELAKLRQKPETR